jgi:hypothetical protein
MTPRLVFMEGGRVTWVVRLVKIGADGEEQRVDVVRTARPGDLGDLANLELTMAAGKLVLADLQKEFVAWQSNNRGVRPRSPLAAPDCWLDRTSVRS